MEGSGRNLTEQMIINSLTDQGEVIDWRLVAENGLEDAFENMLLSVPGEVSGVYGKVDIKSDNLNINNVDLTLLENSSCSNKDLYVYLSKQSGTEAADLFLEKGVWSKDIPIPKNSEVLNADGSINWSKAPEGGYELDLIGNAIKNEYIPAYGEVIDRYGSSNGRYVSPIIDGVSFEYIERSLPYVEDYSNYHKYEVVGDFRNLEKYVRDCSDEDLKLKIEALVDTYYNGNYNNLITYKGKVADVEGWGIGGAVQYEFPLSMEDLENLGLIKEIRDD